MNTESIKLWQLISPTLPVGGYSYSQGLEYAVHNGSVHDRTSAQTWIAGLLHQHLACADLPVLARIHAALCDGDTASARHWSAELIAMRESAELRFEDASMGNALAVLMHKLGIASAPTATPTPYAGAFAAACAHWSIPVEQACAGYAWSWCEAQVAAAVKLIPLGHTDGQSVLLGLGAQIDHVVTFALALDDDQLGMSLPGLAIMSALHETQYTRLFRS